MTEANESRVTAVTSAVVTEPLTDPIPSAPPRSQWVDVWHQFSRHRGALAGLIVFVAIILTVLSFSLLGEGLNDTLNPRQKKT